jgi:hypothetical protein
MSATDEIRWLCTMCREVFTATTPCQCTLGQREAETSIERARACALFATPDGEDSEAVKATNAARADGIRQRQEEALRAVDKPVTFTVEYVNGSMVDEEETRRHLDRMFAGMRKESQPPRLRAVAVTSVCHVESGASVMCGGPVGPRDVTVCMEDADDIRPTCRACEDVIRALSPMPVPRHRMFKVTNEQTWEEP